MEVVEVAGYAQPAKEANCKYAEAYLLSGDAALKLNNVSKVCTDYS